MRRCATLLLLLGLAWPARAAKTMPIGQMEQFLAQLKGKTDGRVAAELDEVQLTERVSPARLARWEAEFPGNRTREELLKLADMSAFLDPPASDVVSNPRPDVKSQLRILSLAVAYVGKTTPRLPDFYALRETTQFAGASQAGFLVEGSVTTALQTTALNWIGGFSRTVTYRDGREIPFENTGKQEREPVLGLTTHGEFGPILLQVLRDALGGRIGFLRWQEGVNGLTAVFKYTVPENASHFEVNTTVGNQTQTVRPAYHGEIEIDPETGEILGLSEIADMTPAEQMEGAAIEVEFGPVTIGGRDYICPVRGVAFSKLRVRPGGAALDESIWPRQTYLNDVAFSHYHEFGSEARMVANPAESGGANAADSSGAGTEESHPGTADAVPSPAASAAPTGTPQQASKDAAKSPSPVSPAANVGAPGVTPSIPASSPSQAAPVAPATSAGTRPGTEAAEDATPSAPPNNASNPPVVAPLPDALANREPILKVTTRLVTVDVVVRNGDHPVSGLKQSDFAVYEDGIPQTIHDFTPHIAADLEDRADAAASQLPTLPLDTFTNLPVTNASEAVTVLLLDGLNTAPSDVQYVRREMIAYLKTAPRDRRIAVFALGQRLRMLQGFTTDTGQLQTTLEKAGAASPTSLLPPGEQKLEEADELADMKAAGMQTQDIAETDSWMANADASQTTMRVDMTLEAMQQLSRYLAGVPGRKNLVWFSGSFPLQFFAMGIDPDGVPHIAPVADFNDEVKETANMLAAARVAVYPVDARGVLLEPMYASSNETSPTNTLPVDFTGTPSALARGGPQGGTFGSDEQLSPGQKAAEHNSLDVFAEQTGGRAVHDSNGLKEAMADALDDGESYYTLAYVPTNTNDNGAQRNIVIRLRHGKGELFYRRSYYADAGKRNGPERSSRTVFLQSMQRGVPASSQIIFTVRVRVPDQRPPGRPLAGANSAMKNPAARYVIDYAANLGTIDLAQNAAGVRQGQVDALVIAYDRDSKLLNWSANSESVALDPSAWEQSSRSGLQIHQVLDLPAGEVYLRVGLYDPASGRFGTLEVPLHVAPDK